jgi:hypothetical protein
VTRLLTCLALSFVQLACVAHEREGDAAVSLSHWRAAMTSYGDALSDDPSSPRLHEKLQAAIAGALRTGNACLALADFGCALLQAEDVLRVAPGNARALQARSAARQSLTRRWIDLAREEWGRDDFEDAWADLQRASEACGGEDEPGAEVRQARADLTSAAVAAGERGVAARNYALAFAALAVAVRLDPALAGRLAEAQASHDVDEARKCEALARARYDKDMKRLVAALEGRRAGSSAFYYARDAVSTGMDDNGEAARLLAQTNVTRFTVGFRLTSIAAQIVPGDYDDARGADDAPDLRVEIRQANRIVYATSTAANRFKAEWAPAFAVIFVDPKESLTVELDDVDDDGNERIVGGTLGSEKLPGAHTFATPRNSFVTVQFDPYP